MTLTLRYAAISDRGLIRSGNQDSVYAGPRLIAVADGMGGMAAGDLASNIVIGVLASLDEDVPRGELTAALADSVEEANSRLRETVEEHPHMEGMGTTLTAFLFSGSSLGMVHIGDSRAYRLRDGRLTQVTKDDTYVQMLVDEGQLSPDEAETHPQRSLLLRALGSHEVEPTFATLEAVSGDRYLLCSDGLSGVVSDDTIEDTLRTIADPHEASDRLVQLALRGGGPDNITVLVADLIEGGYEESEPIVAGAAAADRGAATAADPSTAAARGAATTARPQPEPVAAEPAAEEPLAAQAGQLRRHRRRRIKWYALITVLLLGIVFSGGYLVVRGQYYVGVSDEGNVAVFRGLDTELFGLPLSSLEYESEVSIKDLNADTRDKVEGGSITADSRDEAMDSLEAVTTGENNVLPPCPEPSPSESAIGETSKSASPSESGSSKTSESASPTQSAGSDLEPGVDCRPTD